MKRLEFVLLAFFSLCACAHAYAARAQGKTTPLYNIILLTPDQLRADYMHTYGYPLADTPNIDQLAQEGTLFLRAYSAGAWTTPSFGTVLTGLFPSVHGMTLPPYQSCGPSITRPLASGTIPPVPSNLLLSPHKLILPELLKARGMTTAVDIANCWAIWDVVSRGWDSLQFFTGRSGPSSLYLTAPQTTSWAEHWLSRHRGERFFLWVHFMEPHSPYNAPPEYDMFKTADDFPQLSEEKGEEAKILHSLAQVGDVHAIRRLEQLYAAKISYMDHYVGELIKTIRGLGLDKNTIVILVSDHAQLLYSHPKDFNTDDHRSVYDADLHIPLIFWGPGISAGRRVDAMACQYDLLPTVLDLENLSIPSRVDGKSLKPILSGSSSQVHQYVYGEETALEPQYSVRDERYKLIESLRSGDIQCFDNATDPNEQVNICAQIPTKAAELKAALDLHLQTIIGEAKSYPDWEDNLALAVIEQRDSKGLTILAPRDLTISPPGGAHLQLTGRSWSLVKDSNNFNGLGYWTMPGAETASAMWRSDTPLIGDYEVLVWYGGAGPARQTLATNADFMVRFKGGVLSFPIDQNHNQGQWNVLGSFHDPVSVELNNRADGPVVAGAARFHRVGQDELPLPKTPPTLNH